MHPKPVSDHRAGLIPTDSVAILKCDEAFHMAQFTRIRPCVSNGAFRDMLTPTQLWRIDRGERPYARRQATTSKRDVAANPDQQWASRLIWDRLTVGRLGTIQRCQGLFRKPIRKLL